jgi:prepilin-type N-terminal cleavage/methylation domain-containing protein
MKCIPATRRSRDGVPLNRKRRRTSIPHSPFPIPHLHYAFTLLEVILALSILAGSIAVLGELIRMGLQDADNARQLTHAEMLCESIIDQVDVGAIPATAVSNTQCDDDSRFLYSISVDPASQTGLLAVAVTVVRDLPQQQHPQKFTLKRWIVDPGMEQQQFSSEEQTAAAQAAAASSSASGGSTGGTTAPGS